jgi:hypothetical protein
VPPLRAANIAATSRTYQALSAFNAFAVRFNMKLGSFMVYRTSPHDAPGRWFARWQRHGLL